MTSLWDPVVAESRLHPSFRQLQVQPGWAAARQLVDEVFSRFPSSDANFIEQFQTTGFDQRVWELALFAGLEDLSSLVDRVGNAPDFRCVVDGITFFVECTTSGPPQGPDGATPPAESVEEFFERLEKDKEIDDEEMAIRIGSPLYSKLQRATHRLPHVDGSPFLLAVEAFFRDGSLWKSSSSVIRFLYGLDAVESEDGTFSLERREYHEHEGKVIPSGFLLSDEARPISAVVFSNSGTISKFNRMGVQAGFAPPGVSLYRHGFRHNPDPEAVTPLPFLYKVGEVPERWSDGLLVIHNPFAERRLARELFSNNKVAQLTFDDDELRTWLPDFHVFTSVTYVFQSPGGAGRPHIPSRS